MDPREAADQAETVDSAEADLTRTLTSVGVDPSKIRIGRNGTVVYEPGDRPDEASPLPPLPALIGPRAEDATGHIELGDLLGEGGMGIVSAAIQVPLDRAVAVKSPRPKATGSAALSLLREAYVLGALAHPNVVPVYMLGRGADDQPLLVMKRVEGTEWSELIAGRKPLPVTSDESDPLEWHLGVLMQVCNAIHFAHSQGIVHRDLKPHNVMIGDYGEVYVVDWGLAVSTRADERRRLPLAKDIKTVSGTPEFMAPEMARADGEKIGPPTDVYQLGACLHVIVTGEARHVGGETLQKMASAFLSTPVAYGPDVPPRLAAICNKAMSREPADRYPSVEAFRHELATFLRHRHATQLTREAHARVGELRGLLARAGEPSPLQAYNLLSEARFAYRQALREWPDSAEAKRGLQEGLELMIGHELDHGAFNAAALLIAELPEPSPELERKSARLRRELDEEQRRIAELERIGAEVDVTIGTNERMWMVIAIGTFFPILYGTLGALHRWEVFTAGYGTFIAIGLAYGALLAAMQVLARRVIRKSKVNRRFMGGLWAVFLAQGMLWPVAWAADLTFPRALSPLMLVYFLVVLTLAIGLEFRMIWAALPLGIGALIAAWAPHWSYELLGLSLFATSTLTALIWRWDERLAPSRSKSGSRTTTDDAARSG